MEPVYLNVPFQEKEDAKALGARWNAALKRWYVPESVSPAPFDKWRLPGKGLYRPRIALIVDGNHLIQACNVRYRHGSEHFIKKINNVFDQSINLLHQYGVTVGSIRFHQGEPLTRDDLGRMQRDADCLGMSCEQAVHTQQIAHHVIEKMKGYSNAGGIPFGLVTGHTQYNGVRLESRRIAALSGGGTQNISAEALREGLYPEIKQKTVDARIVCEMLYYAQLDNAEAPNGFALMATDTDFRPGVEYADDIMKSHLVHTGRQGEIIWLGVGDSRSSFCPYERIRSGCRFVVGPKSQGCA